MTVLSAELHPNRGFHATYTTQISLSAVLPDCTLHLFHLLPAHIFVDPYELTHHRDVYTFKHVGKSNLELPVTSLHLSGSALLLNVTLPEDVSLNITVDVPMHARYGRLALKGQPGFYTIEIPWPLGFWLCDFAAPGRPDSRTLPEMPTELLSLFTLAPLTFMPISSHTRLDSETIRVPIGQVDDRDWVEIVMAVLLTMIFAHLVFSASWTASRLMSSARSKKRR